MSLTVLFILGRLFHFSAVILMFGISIFIVFLTPQQLKTALGSRLNNGLNYAIIANLLTAAIIVSVQGGLMGEGWGDAIDFATIAAVLETTFGKVWLWQLLFSVLSALCLFISPSLRFKLIAGLSAALLINLGFVGHVTISTGLLGVVHPINHAIHLLSGGYWLGTLVPLLMCLRYLSDPTKRKYAISAMIKFSNFGHIAVLLVIISGIINTAIILGSFPVHWSSPYQRFLGIKIFLVIIMIGIALYNRYILVPRIRPGVTNTLRCFTACTLLEIIAGAIVLSLVSFFATLSPT